MTPTHFTFLNWNIFLALLPLDFAILVNISKHRVVQVIFSLLWLLFYPNTMYMITDFIHLQYIGIGLTVRMQYFNYAVLAAGVFIGVVLGMLSIELMLKYYFRQKHEIWQLTLLFALSLLASVGIYLGRFLRLNSWDVFTQTHTVARLVVSSTSMHMLAFVLLFAGVQFAILVISHFGISLIYNIVDKNEKNE
ncbi:membrane protein [Leuconostoc litchii]|nr:membrane protein [Leuconostoc litchii]